MIGEQEINLRVCNVHCALNGSSVQRLADTTRGVMSDSDIKKIEQKEHIAVVI